MFTFNSTKYYNQTNIYLNLTVAGFMQLTNEGYSLVSGNTWVIDSRSSFGTYRNDIMVVDWDNTFQL